MPKGIAKSDWQSIRAAYEAGRHQFYKQEDGSHEARNPGLGWKMKFDERGFVAKPNDGSWEWGLELQRDANTPACTSDQVPVTPASNTLQRRLTPAITEWFINDLHGLEQGWTLASPAEIRLRVRGNLKPSVSPQSISFGSQITYSGLKAWDSRGKVIPTHFEATEEGFDVRYDDTGAQYPITIDPVAQQAYMKASNTDSFDNFGYSVAVSGETAVIGAPLERSNAIGVDNNQANNSAANAGAAYVFTRSGTTWTQQAYLKASNTEANDLFGWSVAVSGDTAVIGALGEDSNATGVGGNQTDNSAVNSGAAYVFTRSGSIWTQQAYLKASNPGTDDQFGQSVALSGDTAIIGAPSERSNATGVGGNGADNSAGYAGAAYVFARSGSIWTQQAYLKASNTGTGDQFGQSVAVSGDTAVIGANQEASNATGVGGNQADNSASNAGAAYVFTRSGSIWAQQAYLKASNTGSNDLFGQSVAVSGNTAIIGAYGEASNATGVGGNQADNSASSSGAAYVFTRSGSTWTQQAYLKASNTEADDYFGGSVAVSGDTAVIGAYGEDGNATGAGGNQVDNSAGNAGAAYVFTRSGSTWTQQAYLKASNTGASDNFGQSVAVSGDTAVIGAYMEDSNATGVDGTQTDNSFNDSGAAYTFTGLGPPPAPTVASISPPSGSTAGGTIVTITGTDLTGATGVTIDGTAATNVVVSNATTLTCTTPAHSSGAVSVLVTTPGGTNAVNTLFTYVVPPSVVPTSATGITALTATLNGTVNPNGNVTTAQFEYGPTASYGTNASVTLSPNNGSLVQGVSASLTALTPGTTYHYRLSATNGGGTSSSTDQTFTTLSSDANLASLTPSAGTLSPVFASGTTSYTAAVAPGTNTLTVTPTLADGTATVKVNGSTVVSGSASGAISLGYGDNTITVAVTAQDGTTTKTYTVIVTRAAPSSLPASFSSGAFVPLTTNGLTATGSSVSLSLGYVPASGTVLTVVNNTSSNPISGTFSNIAQGQTVALAYGGVTYNFTADYLGGDGNDLVLMLQGAGVLDYSFGTRGKSTVAFAGYSYGTDYVLQPDGKIVGAGFVFNGVNNDIGLVRCNADGTLDTTFNSTGKTTLDTGNEDYGNAVALQSDGKIVVAGKTGSGSGGDTIVVRYLANGTLDTTFNGTGKVITAVSADDDYANAVVIQPDGKIVVAGAAKNGTYYDFSVVRYKSNGDLDTGFGGTGKVTLDFSHADIVWGMALQADGKLVLGGHAGDYPGTNFALARYNADGSLDTGFNGTGKLVTDFGSDDYCYSVSIQTDGKILAAGQNGTAGVGAAILARYNLDGSLDATFGSVGKVTLTPSNPSRALVGRSVATQGDGKIVMGGYYYPGSSTSVVNFSLWRLSNTGLLDTSFHGTGRTDVAISTGADAGRKLLVQPDGKLLVAGQPDYYGAGGFTLVRFLGDVDHAATFASASSVPLTSNGFSGAGQTVSLSLGFAAVPGQVLTLVNNTGSGAISAEFTNLANGQVVPMVFGGITYSFLASYTGGDGNDLTLTALAGALDNTFNAAGIRTTAIGGGNDWANAAVIQSDGKTVVVGTSNNGSNDDIAVVRYTTGGALDSSFGTGGKVTVAIGSGDDSGRRVALQPDGKILVCGETSNGSYTDSVVVRLNTNGSLDTSFNGSGKAVLSVSNQNDGAYAVTCQSDGKVLLAGHTNISGSNNDFSLIRYNSDGSLDTGFGTGGKTKVDFGGGYDIGFGVAVQSDGAIVVAGIANYYGAGGGEFGVARFTAAGGLDTSFGSSGTVITAIGTYTDEPAAVTILSSGKILVAGHYNSVSDMDFAMVRYNSDGSLDTSFNGTGKVTTQIGAGDDVAMGMAVQSDGKILLGGYASNGSNDDFAIARYNANGTLDTSFNGTGKAILPIGSGADQANAIAVQADGGVVLAGTTYNGTNNDFAIVRYTSESVITATFATATDTPHTFSGLTATGRTLNVTLGFAPAVGTELLVFNNTGTSPITGTFIGVANGATVPLTYNSVTYNFVANYSGGTGNDLTLLLPGPGGLDYTFNSSGKLLASVGISNDVANGVAVQGDGKIVLAGYTLTGSNWDFAVVRCNADGSLDTTFNGTGKVVTAVGSGDDFGISPAIQSDGKILVAGYAKNGGSYAFALVRYNPNGTLDTSFNSSGKIILPIGSSSDYFSAGSDYGQKVVLQSDGKILLGGNYTHTNGNNYCAAARLNTDGTLDTSFNGTGRVLTPFGQATGMALQSDGKIVLTGVTNGSHDFAALRYNANGSLDTSFNGTGTVTTPIGSGDDTGYSMALQSDGKIVVVGRSFNGADYDFAVVRYNANGSLDTSFNGTGKVTTTVGSGDDTAYGVAIQSDGKIVVGGPSSSQGSSTFAVVRYNTNGTLDTSFHGSGMAVTNIGDSGAQILGLTLQTDGKIVAAGAAINGGFDDIAVARFMVETSHGATFSAATDVPLSFNGLNAAGQTINLALNCAPSPGDSLKIFDNTGPQPIAGEFSNLTHGQAVALSYSSTSYGFVANYFGGDGNDLTLEWANTKLAALGSNDSGQLGIAGGSTQANVPAQVVATTPVYQKTILAVSAGQAHSLAVCADGTVAAWGSNANGQLGDGTTSSSTTPVAVVMSGALLGKKIIAVAAGAQHSLALCSDGTLAAWGDGSFGQIGDNGVLDRPTPVLVNMVGALSGRRVVAISASASHSVALCSDGTVFCWGDNTNGELGNGGNTRSLQPAAVTTSGALLGRSVVAVACGQNHTLALLADGAVAAWGANASKQLGNSSTTASNVPVLVDASGVLNGRRVAKIAAGGNSGLVLCSDGFLAAWGLNDRGQLGVNSASGSFGTPQAVVMTGALSGKTVSRIQAGYRSSSVVCRDGSMAAWGAGTFGQLGNNTTNDSLVPVTVDSTILGGVDFYVNAAAGAAASHELVLIGVATNAPMIQVELAGAVLVDGSGTQSYGSTLVGTTKTKTFTIRNTGTQVLNSLSAAFTGTAANKAHYSVPASPAASLQPGDATTCTVSFTPTSTGNKPVTLNISNNLSGSLNPFDIPLSGSGSNSLTFTYNAQTDVVATGSAFTATGKTLTLLLNCAPSVGAGLMVVNNTGTGFINGVFGNVAQGQAVSLTYSNVTYNFVANYYGGDGNDLVLQWAGTRLLAWGANSTGTLGNNSTSQANTPVAVSMSGVLNGKTVVALACAERHTLALCADNTLAAWGANNAGQLGTGNTTPSTTPVLVNTSGILSGKTIVAIAAGYEFSLALCSDGTVAAWGMNGSGQLGDGSFATRLSPVAVSTAGVLNGRTVTLISAGLDFVVARCSDGTLAAWGGNDNGQLGDGTSNGSNVPVSVVTSGVLAGRTVSALTAGSYYVLALCTDGRIAAWGDNGYGTFGDGTVDPSAVAVLTSSSGLFAGRTPVFIGASESHSAAVCADGTLGVWGDNTNGPGQLGVSQVTADTYLTPGSPVLTGVLAGKTITSFALGQYHTVAVLSDGTLSSWGNSIYGQLGNGSTTFSETPVNVTLSALGAGERIIRVTSSATARHNLALVALPLTQPGGPPVVTTNAATSVDKTIGTLNGLVSPNSLATTAYFEYGATTSYGTQTSVQTPGSGSTSVALTQALTGLQANTTYHFRIVATNSGGTAVGSDLTFTTLPDPPLAFTTAANSLTNNSATLTGTVNPNTRATTIYFEFGTDTLYGNSTAPQNIASGSSNVNVIAPISGLALNTTYHCRLVAQNAGGAAYGSDVTFTTTAISAPTLGGLSASSATTNSVLLNGFVNPNGATTVYYFEFGLSTSSNFERITDTGGLSAGTSAVNVSLPGVQLTPGTQYRYRLVAENASGVTRSGESTFTTLPLPPIVNTQAATALSTTSARLNGDVRAQNGSAAVTFEWGTDGVNFPNSLAGTPSPVTGDTVTVVSADLSNLQQFTTYSFRVKAASAGGVSTGNVLTFQPQIISGLTLQFPSAPSASTGAVTVTLHNGGSTMGWRFIGEQNWRASGATAGGMTTGDRDIEYRAVPGYVQPPQETVTVTAGQPAVQVDREYFVTPVSGSGGLTVNLKPDTITSGTGRAQWRLLGEDDMQWRDSGVTISSLAAGTYLIECKAVSGRTTPAIATVQVSAGATSSPTITYYLADSQTGTPPSALAFSTVSGDSTKPYAYAGQIRSNAGLSSGFVVKARVVATAAHVVFDDGTLSAAQGLQWLFQRDAGTYEPKPIVPRGFYLFDGYAAQRTADNSPGSSSPQSQNLDVAAIYFNEDAGRGGFGGFLASDLTNNEFILSNANKTLVGYPIDGIALADQGRMHATPIANVTFTNPYGRTFATTGIRSSGGNSGGPLCVQHSNGNYYAAAVYLGGTNQTVVRAIDSSVIDLFNRAEVSGGGGANNTGGGITHTSVTGIASSNPGAIQVIIEPAGARTATPTAGGWRLLGATSSYKSSGSIQGNLAAGVYQLDLTTPTGYQAPTQPTVTITGGQQTTATFTYVAVLSAQESWRQANFGISTNTGSAADNADPDGDGMTNFAEYTAGTNPNSGGDVFKVKTAVRSGSTFSLTTDGKSARTYLLERNLTLDSASWSIVATQGPLGADGTVTLTDPSSPAGRAFYRIRVSAP
ncbi:cadherin-like beta sandwich domain-containing protein [Prosthecobacter sp.]|uniref:RCC1 domain-containing protein n=1 Tax=Prosthecobacter sp. TaxID=1965333 RepID=UPI0037841A14